MKNIEAEKYWDTCLSFYKNLIISCTKCTCFPNFIVTVEIYKIYNLGLIRNYATRFWQKSSCWDYFDKTIKLTGSIECVIVILRTLLSFLWQRSEKNILEDLEKIMEDAVKKTESISTYMSIHLLNLANFVKQTPKKLANDTFSGPKADRRTGTLYQFKNT